METLDTLDMLRLAAAPLICGGIGWLTNYLAIKMLFRPHKPRRILFFTVQGVFPKRQKALAQSLGRMVEKELVNHDDLNRVIHDPSFLHGFDDVADAYIDDFVKTKLAGIHPMAGAFIGGAMGEKVKGMLADQLKKLIPAVLEKASAELENRLDFRQLVEEKVEALSLEQLEDLLFTLLRKEFKFVELTGAVLGFVIGLFQAVLFMV